MEKKIRQSIKLLQSFAASANDKIEKSYSVFESIFYGLFPMNGKKYLEDYFHADL